MRPEIPPNAAVAFTRKMLNLFGERVALDEEMPGADTVEELAAALTELMKEIGWTPVAPTDAQYRSAARKLHQLDGKCEIDDGAVVSRGHEHGAYVQAWVWANEAEALAETAQREESSDDTKF